jgi:DNA-binding Lrp family transcriptional regulator
MSSSMVTAISIAMTPVAPIPTLRFALRAAAGFAVDLLKIYRADRSFADAMILAALIQSNSAPLAGDQDLQREYAVFATPVPAALRRAISVNAIAASLGLPFETVRRRTKRLIADGLCEATPQGVRFSDEVLISAAHERALGAAYETARALYVRLCEVDCVQFMELPQNGDALMGCEPPVRIVWRASADYFLRIMELLLPSFDSLTRAFIVLEVARANTEGRFNSALGQESLETEIPDTYRTPVRGSEVASRLGLPPETVRRHLAAVVEDGRCRRLHDGYIVPAAVLDGPNALGALSANFRNLGRMFAELAEIGVLARWDAEQTSALGRA